ncbi:MAG: hypothetical protein ACRCU6_11300 [Fusobacteriaceae bacterium]
MKKIFSLKNIYLLIVTYFIWIGITGEMFLGYNLSQFMTNYFGRTQYVIYAVLMINYFISYVENEKKKFIFTIINYYIYIGVLSVIALFMIYRLEIFSQKNLMALESSFMELSLFQYKLGMISTYLNFVVIFNENRNVFYAAFGIAIFNSILLLVLMLNWGIFYHLKKVRKGYLLREKMEREEKELQEKIAMKEMLEKKEVERLKRVREETERRIREEVTNLNFGRTEYEITEIRHKIQKEMEEKNDISI